MRVLSFVAVLLACSSAASAQQSNRDALASLGIKIVEPMSANELARTRNRIAAQLAQAGATAVFQDISNQYGGRVTHRPSGLVCPLGKKGQRILTATARSASCETTNDSAAYRQTVEIAPAGASLEWAAGFAQSLAEREPGYRPTTGMTVTARPRVGTGAAEHRTLRYVSRTNGRERAVRVHVGLVRGWMLTERSETRKDASPNSMADLLSEATFGSGMTQKN